MVGTLREVFKEHGNDVAAALEAYQRARIEPTSQEVDRAFPFAHIRLNLQPCIQPYTG